MFIFSNDNIFILFAYTKPVNTLQIMPICLTINSSGEPYTRCVPIQAPSACTRKYKYQIQE